MSEFLQIILSGLATGSIYALAAIGFTLLWQASQTINFVQGEFVMLPAFFALVALHGLGLPFWAALAAALAVSILVLGGITARDQGAVKRRIAQVMEQFPILRQKANEPAIALSGGQQKQLEIARALLLDPKLILIDEPSIGLSPNLVQEVFQTLIRLRDAGVTILMVEQNAKAALAMSDYGIVLELGQTRLHDRAAALLADPRVGELFLGGSIARETQTA